MIEFYFKLVKAKKLTLEKVPIKYREQVRLLLGDGDYEESEVEDG